MTAKNKLHLDKPPRITISSVCTWDEDTCTWIPKTKKQLSETLRACVVASKTQNYNGDLKFGGKTPTKEQLKPYKVLPVHESWGNSSIAKTLFGKDGTPSLGQLYRAQKNAQWLNQVVKTFYWMSPKALQNLVADYNAQLTAAGIDEWHLLKVLKMKPKPKALSRSDIANYLVSKGVSSGEYSTYEADIEKIEKTIEGRTK
jgi:hypothetical protein